MEPRMNADYVRCLGGQVGNHEWPSAAYQPQPNWITRMSRMSRIEIQIRPQSVLLTVSFFARCADFGEQEATEEAEGLIGKKTIRFLCYLRYLMFKKYLVAAKGRAVRFSWFVVEELLVFLRA